MQNQMSSADFFGYQTAYIQNMRSYLFIWPIAVRSLIKVALFLALSAEPGSSSDCGLEVFFDKVSGTGDGTSAKPGM